ncbi:MAG: bifunctional biotin--[acetyl-CoA-carboxylase] ligase/biotin operon repressor BirA [Gammaproteobacteria bacterium]
MATNEEVLRYLADGKFHSGEALAQRLGISRTAIWKRIHTLSRYGVDVYSVRGRGYRLAQAIELYDEARIRSYLSGNDIHLPGWMQIVFKTGSTNQLLLDYLPEKSIHGRVTLAEFQSAGRGRRGRSWIAPAGAGICLSAGWHFDSQPASMTALSLASGVAVASALKKLGITEVFLKWPNDIVSAGKKLGGILIELRGETAGPCDVVLGIGVNVNLPADVISMVDQPITDLARLHTNPPSRNHLAGAIISETLSMLEKFATHGFSPFIDTWRELDYGKGKDAVLVLPHTSIKGRVLGIDEQGMLSMEVLGERKTFNSGELSLRVFN